MADGTKHRLGRFDVDLEARHIHAGPVSVELHYRPFEALKALIEARGDVVDRDSLHRCIWPDAVVDETSLNKCVSDLRRGLATHDPATEYVETVRGRGYRLAVPVEAMAADVETRSGRLPFFSWKLAAVAGFVAVAAATLFVQRGSDSAMPVQELMAEATLSYQAREYAAASTALRRAIELDPQNGPVHSQLAHVVHRMRDVTTDAGLSLELAEKGVALAPECAECQGTLGFFLFYHHWQWARAREHYSEALRLDPDNHGIRQSYSYLLAATGELEEALRQAETVAEAAPTSPGRQASLAQVLYLNGRYEDAITAANRAVGLDRKRNEAWEYRARSELALGRVEDAVRTMIVERYKQHADIVGAAVAIGGGEAGLDKLLELTSSWPERSEVSWRRAVWFATRHQEDQAIDALEDAVAQHNINLMFTAVDPLFAPLRRRPRFQALLQTMGFVAPLTSELTAPAE